MATKLLRPVRREMLATVQHGKYRNRPIILELEPGDVIRFKVKGTRQFVECSLHSAYTLAQLITYERLYAERLKEYEAKRKSGRRAKRPKRPKMFVDKVFIQTIKTM
jgi:hypothetical protein